MGSDLCPASWASIVPQERSKLEEKRNQMKSVEILAFSADAFDWKQEEGTSIVRYSARHIAYGKAEVRRQLAVDSGRKEQAIMRVELFVFNCTLPLIFCPLFRPGPGISGGDAARVILKVGCGGLFCCQARAIEACLLVNVPAGVLRSLP